MPLVENFRHINYTTEGSVNFQIDIPSCVISSLVNICWPNTYHKCVVLVSSVGTGLDSKSFQLDVLIVRVRVQAGAECAKIAYSMSVQIAQARVAPKWFKLQ